ncbi:MAG: amidohydrolase family protein, partial [SAR324 cluster bacterium]|nr:amidohydrolase family protein [SAR324 cluster bacterium]
MTKILDDRYLEEWLAQEDPEKVLDPELPIVDPHHHLWDLRKITLQPHRDFLQKVYLTEEFANEIQRSGHKITHTVFAQCAAFYRKEGPEELKAVGEVEFANGVAAMSASGLYGDTQLCAGIFSYADLSLGKKVKSVLESLQNASPNFRGIRSPFPSDLNSEFLEGFKILGEMGLTYDNYSPDYTRLPKLAELAATHPEVTVIVNHLGGRINLNEQEWRECLEKVSKQKNVYLKLGGAQQRVNDWEPAFHR